MKANVPSLASSAPRVDAAIPASPSSCADGPDSLFEIEQNDTLSSDAIRSRAAAENFPVVFFGLPRLLRRDLLALYDYARLVDQVGDEVDGDRLALLDELSRDVERISSGEPRNTIVARLAPIVHQHALPLEALERLIEANRRDQSLRFVSTWDELIDTCTRSANPVGELVLGILGQANAETVALSNDICSALQVVEHCQDVQEDFFAGRVYLPEQDMMRFGCRPRDLDRDRASTALRLTIRLEVTRARTLLAAADPLLCRLRGIGLPLVAAYAAGGLAVCDALERHDFDVLSFDIRPGRRAILRHWVALCWRALRSKAGP